MVFRCLSITRLIVIYSSRQEDISSQIVYTEFKYIT